MPDEFSKTAIAQPPPYPVVFYLRFLNIYGFGYCDDSAVSFSVLAEKAGLKSRVWDLSGHVAPEVFYDKNGILSTVLIIHIRFLMPHQKILPGGKRHGNPKPGDGIVEVSKLNYTSEIQLTPHTLPTLITGNNTIKYFDNTGNNRNVKIKFTYGTTE